MKKTLFTIIGVLTVIQVSWAQLTFAPGVDYNFIRDAIRPSISLIRSTYFLADTTQRYASTNDTVFSTDFSVAYAVRDGLIASRTAVMPWLYDKKFDEYRGNCDYTAVINDRTVTALSEMANYQPLASAEILSPISLATSDSTLYLLNVAQDERLTLECTEVNGDVDGFIAWFVATRDMNLYETSDLNIKITQTYLVFNDGNTAVEAPTPPKTMGKLLGGLFLVPVIERAGVIELKIAGFVVPNVDNNTRVTVYKSVSSTFDEVDEEGVSDLYPVTIIDVIPTSDVEPATIESPAPIEDLEDI